MKTLAPDQLTQCQSFDGLINHYYSGSTAAFIRSEGGDDSNISKMRRGIIAVSKKYLHLIGAGSCKSKANSLK